MTNFNQLIETIQCVHHDLHHRAVNAINQTLTIRNWLIGYYIVEFELNGKDRATYGEKLISTLAERLKTIRGVDRRALFRFRNFYLTYPHFIDYLSKRDLLIELIQRNDLPSIVGTVSPQLEIVGTVSPQSDNRPLVPTEKLITQLSFSHIELLLKINDDLKRTFYEIECIKGTWSVRELKRQIASLYYERSGLSADPEKLNKITQTKTAPQKAADIIKNIYAFEFLDIRSNETVEESDLESALLNNLQSFITELGNGFCFEARQKRLLIGENYYFVDLVFYHRILKSHILLELKIGEFQHGDIGQLNTYINYFKEEISEDNDNLPVGILLVAEKDQALVKYATAGMDENLFVKKYLVNLPNKTRLEQHINKQLQQL